METTDLDRRSIYAYAKDSGWPTEAVDDLNAMARDADLAEELLEALEYADGCLDTLIGDDPNFQLSAAPTVNRVKAALAKAHGEAQDG